MNVGLRTIGIVVVIGLAGFVAGCPFADILQPPGDPCAGVTCDDGDLCTTDECVNGECINLMIAIDCPQGSACDPDTGTCVEVAPSEPQGFLDADAARGGALYDKWWAVAELDAPTGDYARWAMRPDQDSNSRTGADTWRCKECHGWDYKGVDGAYGSGSHRTGFGGIFGTTKSAQEVFDTIDGHGFGDVGLVEGDIWDLAKFVKEGQIDTDDIIGADKAFIGDVDTGQVLYDDGIGTNTACAVCHGADGRTIEFHEDEFLGELAAGNPWEFQHKVWFGHPGSAMPVGMDVGATNDDVAAVGAYSQTLAAP